MSENDAAEEGVEADDSGTVAGADAGADAGAADVGDAETGDASGTDAGDPGADSGSDATGSGDGSDADATAAGGGTDGDDRQGFEVELADELVERVADSDPAEIANEISSLRLEVDRLETELADREAEIDDLESKIKRKQADFQNYKKRMKKRREQEKQRATEDLVERLLDVRDNLDRALDQDEDADIRDGIAATLDEFDRVLDDENVEIIEPEPGEETDPQRHEVLMRVESDQPADTIADLHRPGYEMAGKVLRPAQVTVSEGDEA
ncbi:nucleotide exchange factor GrpE [Halobacteriales archaeon QS_1_68_17]|nr:MAG: nucleotide exchange factor GrpE [Halobacteriales archaeon QS_1_68_17]